MKERQSTSGDPEEHGAFGRSIVAVVIVLIGALAYFHVLQKRFEIPVEMPPVQTAPGELPSGALPGKERPPASGETGLASPGAYIRSY